MAENNGKDTQGNTTTVHPLEGILNSINEISPELGGMEGIVAVMSLPDEEFELMKEIIIDELEKSLNNANDKLMLVSALNSAGMKSEELIELYEKLIAEIDGQLATTLGQSRADFLKRVLGAVVNAISSTEGIGKRYIQIPTALLHENAKLPAYKKPGDAGMDVYAIDDFEIKPGETLLVPTGVAMALPLGFELQVRPRSGLALKTKMRVANSPGTIDSNYRDEIGIIIDNIEPRIKDLELEPVFEDGQEIPSYYIVKSVEYGRPFTVAKGERFAQLVLTDVDTAVLYNVDTVKGIGDDRGGGFGHTGA